MILPALIIAVVFYYFPMYGIIIAFKDFDIFSGITTSPWASQHGFEHFYDLFKTPGFFNVLKNTVIIAILKLGFMMWPPVVLAIVLNEVNNMSFKRVTQSISYLPHFISWVVLGGIFYNILNPSNGPVNEILMTSGLLKEPIDFIFKEEYFRGLVVVTDVWKTIGWNSIIYLAVIAGIDPNLYEAIDINGGGRLAKIVHITWPALKGTFVILFILKAGRFMAGNEDMFEQCYIFGNYANRSVSDILDTFILRTGLENTRFSYATAAGLIKSVISLTTLWATNKLSKMLTDKSLF